MANLRLSDIAKLAGVSKATVSRALAKSPLVKEETRNLIEDIASKHNYRPNSIAQAIATKRSCVIGFLVYHHSFPYFGHSYYGPVLDGAIDEAARYGYHIVLARALRDDATFDEHFISDAIDGALLVSANPQPVIQEFKRRGIPLVLINDRVHTQNVAFIMDDDYTGMSQIMEHLIVDRGHKSIAILSDRFNHPGYLPRYMAYVDAHNRHNLTPYSNPLLSLKSIQYDISERENYSLSEYGLTSFPLFGTPIMTKGRTAQHAENAVKQLLMSGVTLPTAIVATTDHFAIGALKAIHDFGLRIPEDIAVTGYDDIDVASMTIPPLTTIRVNRDEIGRRAVRELIAQIGTPSLSNRGISIANELVVRQST